MGAGRPVKKINWVDFDKLCHIQCTLREIASFFEVSEDTIERACKREKSLKFAEYYAQKSAKGHISIRRAQFQLAIEGRNTAMLIWLGKQYLNQSDKEKIEQTLTTTNTTPTEPQVVIYLPSNGSEAKPEDKK